ncbi:lipoprotein, NlpC/P60 family (SH3 domains) [Campylobacter avium LMG 24591]|uniref:Lipoprotein, NlpC/P60 family (SH3 domains) n=1 Tax=Campylobacter avium LMG 24591 TaxID=522484 RepID=A0A222MX70_9BACT|nr:SH3 domain-containing C40 family peptidase [Campylobacter avium]ASQ30298.1 lipoprotein, NlpC/P60 family (SH3 domains) [Campylobacter avium LMG 24591]OYD79396.1 lipoprotein, NlpC/P60 family (SH3 domains) [Campylobacter avium]
MRVFVFIFALFFISCSSKVENLNSKYADLKFKQDINSLVFFDEKISQSASSYKAKFFTPWHSKLSKKSYKQKDIFWSFALYLSDRKYYFFNKQEISKSYFKKLIDNANVKDFLSLKKKAIITKTSNLKNLPSKTAILLNPFKEGEGLPFDYSLDSVLNIGSPVLISHFTKDKEFAFVLAESGFGFVEARNLELFTEQRAKTYEKLNFITPIKERFPVLSLDNNFAFELRVGAIYPYYAFENGHYIGKIGDLKYKIPSYAVSAFPLSLNDKNLKMQLKELFARPYGWGGYDFERDCSLFIRDLFASFGFYLPRNSYAQSLALKRFDISKLSNLQKQDFIKKYAKPYTTLLYLRGHIMLYAGVLKGENVALHSIWGIRTKDDKRLLVGKSALTTLDVGKESSEVDEKDLILSRLSAISFLSLSENELLRINEALEKYH